MKMNYTLRTVSFVLLAMLSLSACVKHSDQGGNGSGGGAAKVGIKNAGQYRSFLARYTGAAVTTGGSGNNTTYANNYASINGGMSAVVLKSMKEMATIFCDQEYTTEKNGTPKLYVGINFMQPDQGHNPDSALTTFATNALLRASGQPPAADEVAQLVQAMDAIFVDNPSNVYASAMLGCVIAATSYNAVTFQ